MTSSELVYTGEYIQSWDEDFAALWTDAMNEANLREKEKQAASLGAHSSFPLSWNVACVPTEPLLTKRGASSRHAQHFAFFFVIWDRILAGQHYACMNPLGRMENWLEKLRLSSKPKSVHVLSVALSVPRREALHSPPAGRRGFRVICAHLNTGSVIHKYAFFKTFARWRCPARKMHMVTFVWTPRLGTEPLRSGSRNIGTGKTITHRSEKQRLLEYFIMELSTRQSPFRDLRLIGHSFRSLEIDSHPCFHTEANTRDRVRQEINGHAMVTNASTKQCVPT